MCALVIHHTLVIHGTEDDRLVVKPTNSAYLFLPHKSYPKQACVALELEYLWKESGSEGDATMLVAVPMPTAGENHYDLVLEDKKVGLRPRKEGKPDPGGEVFWPGFDEPSEWHPNIIVKHVVDSVGLGGFPTMQIGYIPEDGKDPCHLLTWCPHWNKGQVYGDARFIWSPVNLSGQAVEALIQGLRLSQQLTEQWGEIMAQDS